MATVAAIVAVAAAAAGATASVAQGQAQKRQARTQAEILRQQGLRERQEAAAREEDFRRQQARLTAARRAILGATGVEPGEGSPLLTSEDFAGETELQALRIRSGGEVRGTRLQQQANLTLQRGRDAQRAGFVRAGASLLSGGARAFGAAQ